MLTPKYEICQYATGRAEFKLARALGHQCHSQRHRNGLLGLQTHTASSSLRDQLNNNNKKTPQSFLCFTIVLSGSSSNHNNNTFTLLMRTVCNQRSAWVKVTDPARVGKG